MHAAWRYCFCACIIEWSYWLLSPLAVFQVTTCNKHAVLARVPPWIEFTYIPILAAGLACEVVAHRWILPQLARFAGPFTVAGTVVPFTLYFVGVSILSVISKLDLATSGLLMSRLMRTETCSGSLDAVWENVQSQSVVGPWMPDLMTIFLMSWGLMGMQAILGFTYGVPWRDFSQLRSALRPGPIDTLSGRLQAPSGAHPNPVATAATQHLAAAARMNLMLFRHDAYTVHVNKWWMPRFSGVDGPRMSCAQSLRFMVWRFAAQQILEIGLQLQLQTSLVGMTLEIMGVVDTFTVASIVLSHTNAIVMGLIKTSVNVTNYRNALSPFPEMNGHVKTSMRFFWVFFGIQLWNVCHSLLKLYMEIVVCRGMWNANGCVVVNHN